MDHITENYRFWHAFLLTWTSLLFSSLCGQEVPKLKLQDQVFVSFKGENLNITYELTKPANITQDHLMCFNPLHKRISKLLIEADQQSQTVKSFFILKNVTISGEYHCQYKTAKAYWFLRVRDNGYKKVVLWDYTEVIIVSVFTGLLLLFSVSGSVYVFRGHWGCCKVEKKTQDEKQEENGDSANVDPAQSSSFYASLDTRPRSIYDVLDHSAAACGPKRKKNQNTVDSTLPNQDEGVFECVYENF